MQQENTLNKFSEGSIREIYFIVPGEVIPKGRPRFTRSGHAYTPKRTTDYETKVKAHYLTEYPYGLAFENEPLDSRYRTDRRAYSATRRATARNAS